MTERSIIHATFNIDRTFEASPARVFQAFANKAAKKLWFGGPPDWEQGEHTFDFRVGGWEVEEGGPPGGPSHRMELIYQDIVPNERLVYSYEMKIGGVRISVSLATIEFKAEGKGTRFRLTEMGAYLDGHDTVQSREEGTIGLMDMLEASLKSHPVVG